MPFNKEAEYFSKGAKFYGTLAVERMVTLAEGQINAGKFPYTLSVKWASYYVL
jgi:hypothetical protein